LTDEEIKAEFPIFEKRSGKPFHYLDSAATSQRPADVIEAVSQFYYEKNANPHRGVYELAEQATESYENARQVIAQFINADPTQVIYTRNATEGLNLVAYSYGLTHIQKGDHIVISILEHHSNLIPWQRVARAKGAVLDYMYTENGSGKITDEEIEKRIVPGVKLVAITQVSNVLGIVTPYEKIIARAHEVGAVVVVDAAQSAPHLSIDVQTLGADFLAFSGHKLFSPLGIGILWGRKDLLEEMPPFLSGGDMIDSVSEQDAVWAPLPEKFEAGTQNAGGAVGLAAAIHWMNKIGMDTIEEREAAVYDYAWEKLHSLPHVTVYGTGEGKHVGAIAFNIDDAHPHDVASILDADGVCVRAGHHCAQPLMGHLGIHNCCRASISVYNTKEDIDALCDSILKVRKWLGYES
jgi:cysteine desulfurase/selenocysteine lyase